MKWFKKNSILFSIFLVLGLFSYWEFQKNKSVKLNKAKAEKLFSDFSAKNIIFINFQLKKQNHFQLQKKEEKWFVVEGEIKDFADKSAVNVFLNKISRIKKVSIAPSNNLLSYGFEVPEKKIIFHNADKRKYQFTLGSKSFDSKRFVLEGEGEQLFVADSHLNFAANKFFDFFRSKRLFVFDNTFDTVTVRSFGDSFTIIKKNSSWLGKIKKYDNKTTPLDPVRADKFISAFNHLEVKHFVRENSKKSKNLLRKYNLARPEFSLSVFKKQKKIWTVDISEDAKKQFVYTKTSARSTIYSIDKAAYKNLSISLNSMRSRSSMFKFDKKNINAVFYQKGKRRRTRWSLLKGQWLGPRKKKLKADKFVKLFLEVSKLQVVNFVPKSTIAGGGALESLSFSGKKGPVVRIATVGYMSSQKNTKLKDLVILDLGDSYEYIAVSSKKWKGLVKSFVGSSK